jgi:exodeoxyribonuclease X
VTHKPDTRPWTAARWVVVDVEGNGQHPPDLVEAACVPVIHGRIGAPRSWLVRPPRPVTWQARRVHGISDADLAAAPTVAEIRADVLTALGGADAVVGHQVHIDLDVLTRSLPGWTPPAALDTLRLARALHPGLASYRLGALADHLALHDDATAATHRARADAVLAARLLVHLANAMGETSDGGTATFDELRNAASRRPSSRAVVPGQDTIDLHLE